MLRRSQGSGPSRARNAPVGATAAPGTGVAHGSVTIRAVQATEPCPRPARDPSVGLAPGGGLDPGLTADGAGRAGILGLEREAAEGGRSLRLDRRLALRRPALGGDREAAPGLQVLDQLGAIVEAPGVVGQVRGGAVEQLLMDLA